MVRCFKNEVKYACKSRRPKSSYVMPDSQRGKTNTTDSMHDLCPVLPVSISRFPIAKLAGLTLPEH